MEASVTIKTTGRLTEDITPSRMNSLLWVLGVKVEDSIITEIDTQDLVDEGAFKDGVHIVPPQHDTISVADGVNYGIFLELGTRPHEITPKNKKALTIPKFGGRIVERGGKPKTEFEFGGKKTITDVVLVKRVMHPGTKAYRPFTLGLIKSQHKVLKALERFIRE